jgi:hypothetical protein
MIRGLITFALFVFGAFFAGIYLAYGAIDPCRALAVEDARRSPVPTAVAQVWTRIETSRMNRLSCSRSLVESWRERISE